MRLCLIGDSHLGHVKPAWEVLRGDYPHLSVGYSVERTYGTEALVIGSSSKDTKPAVLPKILLSHSPRVDCDQWDAFVVFGMHYSIATLAKLYPSYRSEEQNLSGSGYVLSESAYVAMIKGMYAVTKANSVINALVDRTDKPIYYAQQPNPLEWASKRQEPAMAPLGLITRNGDETSVAARYESALGLLAGRGVRVVRQPQQTVSGTMYTKSSFGLADVEDTSGDSLYSRGDYYHMNSDYGRLALNDIFASL